MVENGCRVEGTVEGVNAGENFAFYSNELTAILKAQPLNPFKPLTITAMSRFPVRPPKADNPESSTPTEVPLERLTIEDHKYRCTIVRLMTGGMFSEILTDGRYQYVKEIEEVYAKLDEVIV